MRRRPLAARSLVALVALVALVGCSGGEADGLVDGSDLDAASDDAPDSARPDARGPDAAATDASLDGRADGRVDARADVATDAPAPPDAPPDVPAPPEKDIDTIPWQTGGSVGFGVASKDTGNPRGESAFIAYAGYNVSLGSAEAWATALYRATLKDRGVRWVWAVQGPADPSYSGAEIGNSKIIAALLPHVSTATKFILAVGHSSGSFVAHELLGQLAGGHDPGGVTDKRVVYFDLDGGTTGLSTTIVDRLRRAYFVGSLDGPTGTFSPNHGDMEGAGATYAAAGGYWQNDAAGSGCNAGAKWCVHVTLITTRPHDPTNADPLRDYSDFAGRPVCTSYLDAKGAEAGL